MNLNRYFMKGTRILFISAVIVYNIVVEYTKTDNLLFQLRSMVVIFQYEFRIIIFYAEHFHRKKKKKKKKKSVSTASSLYCSILCFIPQIYNLLYILVYRRVCVVLKIWNDGKFRLTCTDQ